MNDTKSRIKHIARDIRLVVQEAPTAFFLFWLSVSVIFFAALFWMGLVPQAILGAGFANTPEIIAGEGNESFGPAVDVGDVEPLRLIIEAADVDTPVLNPESRDVAVLDEALHGGAVHYPGSGNLNDTSNMFIFGHSSYLPNVINEAYKAFNGIQNLVSGDVIKVHSVDEEYVYVVETVSRVDANDAWVELSSDKKKLTLSTCNNFGQKQDRFVVEAQFVGSYKITQGS